MDGKGPFYVVSLGNKETFIYKVENGSIDIVMDPVTGRSLKTVIAFTKDTRLFSGLAVSSTCPYEGRIAYNILEKLGTDEKFKFNLGGDRDEEYTSCQLISYFLGNICDRFQPRPTQIGIVIPKWWDDKMKQDLIDAAKIADVGLVPVHSNFAHAISFYDKISISDDSENYIGLVDAGATGFDITFSKIKHNLIETIIYRHINFGGEDITAVIATEVLKRAKKQYKEDKEVSKLLKDIENKKDKSQYRIFYKEAEKLKESLAPGMTTRFDPKTLKHEVRIEIKYDEIMALPEIQDYYKSMVEKLKGVKEEFDKKIGKKPMSCFDVNGGNGILSMTKAIVAEAFPNIKMTGFLNTKEAIASGAASYFRTKILERNINDDEKKFKFIDEIIPYEFYNDNKNVFQKPNEKILLTIEHPKLEPFNHEPQKYQEVLVVKLKTDKLKPPEFTEFKMLKLKIPNKLERKAEVIAEEKKIYQQLLKKDQNYTKVGELINKFQGQTIELSSFVKNIAQKSLYQDQIALLEEINTLSEKYEDEYNKNSNIKDKNKIQQFIDDIYNDVTDFVIKVMNDFAGKYEDVKPLKPNDELDMFNKYKDIIQKQKISLRNAIEFGSKVKQSDSSPNCSKIIRIEKIETLIQEYRDTTEKLERIEKYNDHICPSQIRKETKPQNNHSDILKPLSEKEKNELLTTPKEK